MTKISHNHSLWENTIIRKPTHWPFRESSNTVLLSEQTVAWRSLQRCRARLL